MLNLEEKLNYCDKRFNNVKDKISIKNIYKNFLFSKKKIKIFKEELNHNLKEISKKTLIILIGSYGRLESSELSDLDYCIVYKDDLSEKNKTDSKSLINSNFQKNMIKKVSSFSEKYFNNIFKNIGGTNEISMDFTTRILILLESIPLTLNDLYDKLINDLCKNYLEEYIRENKYPLFLTNEIIRFWRTLCIDYRWKKMEIEKPWGIRNIKLRFSRKLLCYSSILLLIMFYRGIINYDNLKLYINYPSSIKLLLLYDLVSDNNTITKNSDKTLKTLENILIGYDQFLENINKIDIRESLIKVRFRERNENEHYNRLKNNAKEFHTNLIELLEDLDSDIIKRFLIF